MTADTWVQLLCGVFTAGSVLGGVRASIAQMKETQKQLVDRLDRCELSVLDIKGTLKAMVGGADGSLVR